MTWYVIDEITWFMFLALASGFFILFAKDLVLFFFSSIGKHLRRIIGIWLKKRVMDVCAHDTGVVEFIGRKSRRGGQLETKIDGRKSVSILPKGSNPIVAKRFFLKGTGIPVFYSYAAKTVAGPASMVAAMQVASSKHRGKLPKEIQEWAKANFIPIKQLKEIMREDEEAVVETTKEPLFTIDPTKFAEFCSDSYDEMQYEAMLESERQEGREEAGKSWGKAGLGIGIVVMVIIGLVFLVGMMGGGGVPLGG